MVDSHVTTMNNEKLFKSRQHLYTPQIKVMKCVSIVLTSIHRHWTTKTKPCRYHYLNKRSRQVMVAGRTHEHTCAELARQFGVFTAIITTFLKYQIRKGIIKVLKSGWPRVISSVIGRNAVPMEKKRRRRVWHREKREGRRWSSEQASSAMGWSSQRQTCASVPDI